MPLGRESIAGRADFSFTGGDAPGYDLKMARNQCIGILLALVTTFAGFASDVPIPLGGRPLLDVLADYEAAGYVFTYSTELVHHHTRMVGEPPSGDAVGRLSDALAAIGLQLRDAPGRLAYLIVPAPLEAVANPMDLIRIAGQVTDADTGAALAGAYIQIGGRVTRTDADGRFELDVRQPLELSISLGGYAPKAVAAAELAQPPADLFHEFELEPSVEEVVVAASRYRIGKRGTLSRHVLDDALALNLPDIGDALRMVNRLPGARTIGLSAITPRPRRA